ncbi:pyrroline-5-carboxylate reductase 1 [Anthonomus grandis grandis]|uniref:pyrroline-5-carboxylate reductase 1 n=1 Tax=Anthonomus grandis grandis TaxID=2921223 RepID=UPI0021659B0B|nr:pyrroline-5-carboxylate reductase 1 [Anthonomus grandis grandis]
MSGPRMGNLGQMNGNRRPISRMNYHDSRQGSSYQDHRQSYQDHRQSSHEGRQYDRHDRGHDSRHEQRHDYNRSHDLRQHENRQYESRQYSQQQQSSHHQNHLPQGPTAQHDELIKYIYESWSKVEMDKGSNNVLYYQEHENFHLKDFRPFDLEAYWGRKVHQNHQHLS